MTSRYDGMELEAIDGRGMELDMMPMADMELELEALGVTPAQYAALDARVQANTNAIGALDGRVDEAEAEIGARYTKAETDGLLAGKANRQQEEWITPTLLNGWVSDPLYPVQYRKNEFGKVELRGKCKDGTNASAVFQAIQGCRPAHISEYVISRGGLLLAAAYVTTRGSLVITTNGTASYHYLDQISWMGVTQ